MDRSKLDEGNPAVDYALPDLPRRAIPQFSNYGFRRQGNEAARFRIGQLETKVIELHEMQDRLRPGHEKLSLEARAYRNDAHLSKADLEDDLGNIRNHSLRSLGKRVATQLEEAIEALDRVLTPLDEAIHAQTSTDHADAAQKLNLRLRKAILHKDDWKNVLEALERKNMVKQAGTARANQAVPLNDHNHGMSTRKSADGSKLLSSEKVRTPNVEAENTPAEEVTIAMMLRTKAMMEERRAKSERPTGEMERLKIEEIDKFRPIIEKYEAWGQSKDEELVRLAGEVKRKNERLAQENARLHSRVEGAMMKEIEELRGEIAKLETQASLDSKPGVKSYSAWDIEEDFGKDKEKIKKANEQELNEYSGQGQRKHMLEKLQREKASLVMNYCGFGQVTKNLRRKPREKKDNDGKPLMMEMIPQIWDTVAEITDTSEDDRPDDHEANKATEAFQQAMFQILEELIEKMHDIENHIEAILGGLLDHRRMLDLRQLLKRDLDLERQCVELFKYPRNLRNPREDGLINGENGRLFTDNRTFKEARLYKDLDDGQFRVLILVPAPAPYYPIICKMETWTVDSLSTPTKASGKQYAALSYCWDSGIFSGQLYFIPQSHYTSVKESEWGSTAKAAFQVPIRNNLYRALLRLRRCGRNARPVALWVDYFCINQADLKEKTKQLPRMVDIYSRASNVCVWLGEGDNDGRSDEAMQFISKIVDFAALDRHSQDPRQARKWYALSELMRDRWFSRRWVVQEIALAKRATVHCGGSMVQWPDFSDAVSLLISNQETIASLFDDLSEWREGRKIMGDVATYGASILLEATNNLFRRKPEGDIKKPAKTIEYLTTSLKTFDTGDPRDLIYSLVSIASDTAGDFWSARSGSSARNRGLAVDYRKSQAVVYKDFTKFCVETSNSLDIICRPWAMPLTDRSSGFLPSWIPLLRNSEFGAPGEANRGRKNGESLVGPAGDPHYQASGQHVCRVKFKLRVDLDLSHSQQDTAVPDNVRKRDWIFDHADNQDVLQATGIRLAQITAVSPRSTGGIIHRESLMMGGWEGFRSDTDSVPDRIWRTLVADRDQNGDLPPSWYRRACFRCLEIADTFNNGDLNVGELLTEKSEMLRKYLSRVRNVTWNRRFFTTELPVSDLFQKGTRKNTEGQYMSGASTATSPESKAETGDDDIKRSAEDSTIRSLPEAKGKGKCVGERPLKPHQKLFGICPSNTRRVDIVCILFGCSVPVILRPKPSSEYFILVGEAYVHGKMDGEEVEDRDSDCENDGADAVDFQIL